MRTTVVFENVPLFITPIYNSFSSCTPGSVDVFRSGFSIQEASLKRLWLCHRLSSLWFFRITTLLLAWFLCLVRDLCRTGELD